MTDPLNETLHRPWPLPERPWVMAQVWHDLLFAHWPVPAEDLRPLIPLGLDIDLFNGQAWIGVVPFGMTGVRLRATPALPWLSTFPETNVRTYVTRDGKPGVWFFSLDAANPLAVEAARRWFNLPYYHAKMSLARAADGTVSYETVRSETPRADLISTYRPTGEAYRAVPGSRDYFLTERYCLYAADKKGRLYRADIHHAPWPLQPASAEFRRNTMSEWLSIRLPVEPPLLHFAARQDVRVWAPVEVGRGVPARKV